MLTDQASYAYDPRATNREDEILENESGISDLLFDEDLPVNEEENLDIEIEDSIEF